VRDHTCGSKSAFIGKAPSLIYNTDVTTFWQPKARLAPAHPEPGLLSCPICFSENAQVEALAASHEYGRLAPPAKGLARVEEAASRDEGLLFEDGQAVARYLTASLPRAFQSH
jgi:hypothetical protein